MLREMKAKPVLAMVLLLLVFGLVAVHASERKAFTPMDIWKLKSVSDPQLSPDGKWIAYVVSITDFDKNSRNSDIWLVSAEGGEPRRMTTSEKSDNHPRWSPDGKRIAFLSSREETPQIYILPVNGGEARKLTDFPGGAGEMIWTHDGEALIFTGRVYPDCPDLDCVKERDEAKEKNKVSAMVHKHLLYRHWDTYEDDKADHIFYISLEGEGPRDLTPGLEHDAVTYWLASAGREFDLSPDGKDLYFACKQDEDQ
ncbi:MAG: PD40 domain-containing protein, partial [Candidatus Krumholzibacteria bacterium]|nr:PD40 domain-containing protein [Candidatus Krumholzibacteria bacterium]